jgi:hypothetical protein
LQGANLDDCHDIPGNTAYKNVGIKGRGLAILTIGSITHTHTHTHQKRLYSWNRRPLSTNTVVNIYAPSGSSKGMERGIFSNIELVHLLKNWPRNCIFGGNFNYFLSPLNCTGGFCPSKTLEEFVKSHTRSISGKYIQSCQFHEL